MVGTSSDRPAILLVPGFGDDAGVYAPLMSTRLAQTHRLVPVVLPGFGASPLRGATTLRRLARFVDERARKLKARLVMAHSAASIIASLAAQSPGSPLNTILSLEGNLTADDAYFSGTAADYAAPQAFKAAFLTRLDALAKDAPAIGRYRQAVARSDATALWELGCDVARFSSTCDPGDLLLRLRRAVYVYNPDNVPATTRAWLAQSRLEQVRLPNASHWKVFDQPDLLAAALSGVLAQ
jgi:pimeloyl-ACP methyl ester carboxylesterase